jgi:hypothetical protein
MQHFVGKEFDLVLMRSKLNEKNLRFMKTIKYTNKNNLVFNGGKFEGDISNLNV